MYPLRKPLSNDFFLKIDPDPNSSPAKVAGSSSSIAPPPDVIRHASAAAWTANWSGDRCACAYSATFSPVAQLMKFKQEGVDPSPAEMSAPPAYSPSGTEPSPCKVSHSFSGPPCFRSSRAFGRGVVRSDSSNTTSPSQDGPRVYLAIN